MNTTNKTLTIEITHNCPSCDSEDWHYHSGLDDWNEDVGGIYDAGMYCDTCEFHLKEDSSAHDQAKQAFIEKQRYYDEIIKKLRYRDEMANDAARRDAARKIDKIAEIIRAKMHSKSLRDGRSA